MSDAKRLHLLVILALLAFASLAGAREVSAQGRADARGFGGSWHYAVYAKDKSELPPAYQSMKLEEVPAFAVDITIRQAGNRLRATCGVVARFLARVEDCGFTATVRNGAAQFRLASGFGGAATVRLTLRGGKLRWQTVRRTGVSYFPDDVTLRRLKPGEIPPYFEKEDSRQGPRPRSAPRAQAAASGRVQNVFLKRSSARRP